MPKIYEQKQDPERESENRSTAGEPGSPEKVQKRNIVLVIAAVLAVVLVVLFYRMARGDEIIQAIGVGEPATIGTTFQQ